MNYGIGETMGTAEHATPERADTFGDQRKQLFDLLSSAHDALSRARNLAAASFSPGDAAGDAIVANLRNAHYLAGRALDRVAEKL